MVIVATVLRRPEEISEFIDIPAYRQAGILRNVISAVDGLRPMRKIMMSMWYEDIEIKKPALAADRDGEYNSDRCLEWY